MSHLRIDSPEWLWPALAIWLIVVPVLWWVDRDRLARFGWIGAVARSVALAALLLSLSQPTIIRSLDGSPGGEVVVLLDRSRSMSVVDSGRTPAQNVAIADAIGLLGTTERPIIATELRTKVRTMTPLFDAVNAARSELEYAQLGGRGTSAAEARFKQALVALRRALLDLQNASHDQANTTRLFSLCRDCISAIDHAIAEKKFETPVLQQRLAFTPNALVAAANDPQEAADASLFWSDASVRTAVDRLVQMPRIDVASRLIAQWRKALGTSAPIVIRAAEPSLSMLTIDPDNPSIEANGAVSDLTGALAAVPQRMGTSDSRTIVLCSDGRQSGVPQTAVSQNSPVIAVETGGPVKRDLGIQAVDVPAWCYRGQTISASVILRAVGLKDEQFDCTVEADGQTSTQHASAPEGRVTLNFPIKLTSPGACDIAVSCETNPIDAIAANNSVYRFVRVSDDSLPVAIAGGDTLHAVVADAPWIETRPLSLPLGDERAVFLKAVRGNDFSTAQWQTLADWVERRGGCLILNPSADADPAALQQITPLRRLLPWNQISRWRVTPLENGGAALDPAENRRRWEKLPALKEVAPITQLRGGVTTLLQDRDSGQAVVTSARLGAGRVVFIGIGDVDRWLGASQSPDLAQFWTALLTESADPPFAARDAQQALDVAPAMISPEQSAAIRIATTNPSTPLIDVVEDDEVVRHVDVRAVPNAAAPSRFTATVAQLPEGDYDVRSTVGSDTLDVPLKVAENYTAELADVNPDEYTLRRFARSTDGDFLKLEEAASLPERLLELQRRRKNGTLRRFVGRFSVVLPRGRLPGFGLGQPQMGGSVVNDDASRFVVRFVRRHRRLRLLRSLSVVLIELVSWLTVMGLIDRLMPLSWQIRLSIEIATAGAIMWQLAGPLHQSAKRIDLAKAGNEVERFDERFAGTLATTVAPGPGASPALLQSVREQLQQILNRVELRDLLPVRTIATPLLIACIAVVILIAACGVFASTANALLLRELLPLAERPPVTTVHLHVIPGDVTRNSGEPFNIVVRASGLGDAVPTLQFRTDDPEFTTGNFIGMSDEFVYRFTSLDRPLTYRVVGGDAISPSYTAKLATSKAAAPATAAVDRTASRSARQAGDAYVRAMRSASTQMDKR